MTPENDLSGKFWPIHLKPKGDEILSSWLVRLAMAHGQKLHTFCSMAWTGKAIWNRDIDKSADAEVVSTLSAKTGTPVEKVRITTLAAYEGVLYEKHNHFGPTAWIMPVGVYHRIRRQFGLQYCPRCLAEDKEPYYRRRWRLAFMVICDKHHIPLRDRCPQCEVPINFHRDELGDFHKFVANSLTRCHHCGFDLREKIKAGSSRLDGSETLVKLQMPITPAEAEFTRKLLRAIDVGFIKLNEDVVTYSLLYFAGLRQLLKILAMQNKRIEKLRQAISAAYGVEAYTPPHTRIHPDIQELGVTRRRQLLGLTRCLLEEWPHRFIELSQKHKVWSSLWLRHLEPCSRDRYRTAPFWFWSVIHDYLYRARRCPSDQETNAAIRYLKRTAKEPNKSMLSRLLGVAVVRKKGVI